MVCAWLDQNIFLEGDLPSQPKYRIKALSELQELL